MLIDRSCRSFPLAGAHRAMSATDVAADAADKISRLSAHRE
jgi:hypothetical protein